MKYKARILVVDDEPDVREVLTGHLQLFGYQCKSAADSHSALVELKKSEYDVVLSDILMPGKDGVWLLKEILESFQNVAVIMVTAVGSLDTGVECMKLGAYDFITKPFHMGIVKIAIERALERRQLKLEKIAYQKKLEETVEERTQELRKALKSLNYAHLQLKESQKELIYRLATAAEFRDPETGNHLKRISQFCDLLSRKTGLDHRTCEMIAEASPMHDVGKIGIPDHILLKPGRLTEEEYEIMKTHTTIGATILSEGNSLLIKMAHSIALTHHERWDGSGYPHNLKGEEIPLKGRIVAIADVFDALTTSRPYKEPFSIDKSMDIIKGQKGQHFDPHLVDIFLEVFPEVRKIASSFNNYH